MSADKELINMLVDAHLLPDEHVVIYNESTEPLEVMSSVCSFHPAILIIDDDFVKPNAVQILKSIRKINPTMKFVFITSDTSIDLGRDISQLGIHYYGIKPLNDEDLGESIRSLISVNEN